MALGSMAVCEHNMIFGQNIPFTYIRFNNKSTMKFFYTRLMPLLLALVVIIFSACQKNINEFIDTNNNNPTQGPDLTTKVRSSVSGFVTNENDMPVIGASVKVGSITTVTDEYGIFIIRNANVVKNAAVVTVTNPGYFKGIKTYQGVEGKSVFFRIKLISLTIQTI